MFALPRVNSFVPLPVIAAQVHKRSLEASLWGTSFALGRNIRIAARTWQPVLQGSEISLWRTSHPYCLPFVSMVQLPHVSVVGQSLTLLLAARERAYISPIRKQKSPRNLPFAGQSRQTSPSERAAAGAGSGEPRISRQSLKETRPVRPNRRASGESLVLGCYDGRPAPIREHPPYPNSQPERRTYRWLSSTYVWLHSCGRPRSA